MMRQHTPFTPAAASEGSDATTVVTNDAFGDRLSVHSAVYTCTWFAGVVVFIVLTSMQIHDSTLGAFQLPAPYTSTINNTYPFEKICRNDSTTIPRPGGSTGYYSCGYGSTTVGKCVNATCVCQPGWMHDGLFTRTENCGMPQWWIPFFASAMLALSLLLAWRLVLLADSAPGKMSQWANDTWPTRAVIFPVGPALVVATMGMAVSLIIRGATAYEFWPFLGLAVASTTTMVVMAAFKSLTSVRSPMLGRYVYYHREAYRVLMYGTVTLALVVLVQLFVMAFVYADYVTVSNLGVVTTTAAFALASLPFYVMGVGPIDALIHTMDTTRANTAQLKSPVMSATSKSVEAAYEALVGMRRTHIVMAVFSLTLAGFVAPMFFVWRVPAIWLLFSLQMVVGQGIAHSVVVTLTNEALTTTTAAKMAAQASNAFQRAASVVTPRTTPRPSRGSVSTPTETAPRRGGDAFVPSIAEESDAFFQQAQAVGQRRPLQSYTVGELRPQTQTRWSILARRCRRGRGR